MGILTRQQGDSYVISSDRRADDPPSRRSPGRHSQVFDVWTGTGWSTDPALAITFRTLDQADEYVRANYAKVMG